jgi:hypothetical protein
MCQHFPATFPAKWVLLLGALILPTIAKADFPSQLWGRSVMVSWNSSGDDLPNAASNYQLSIYVSGAGRTFSRMAASGARSALSERGPSDATVSTAASVYFANGALLADAKTISGALRVAITFDGAYGRCNARVIFAGDGGALVHRKDITASSCSIVDGNVLRQG